MLVHRRPTVLVCLLSGWLVIPWREVGARFNGVKVFCATMFADRARLGETVTAWIQAHPSFTIVEFVVRQSSDDAFHALSITVFYWEELKVAPQRTKS